MMKNLVIITFVSLISLVTTKTYGQKSLYVEYKEFVNIQVPLIRDEALWIDLDKNTSIYASDISHQVSDEKIEKEILKKETGSSNFVASIGRIIDNDYVIIDYNEKKVELIEDHGKKVFHVEDAFLDKNWILFSEKKYIQGYEVFKATVHLRGVDWEVWYAPDLPYSYGPWKLNGLPGLILEAKTFDGFYTFKATSIEFDTNNKIDVPYDKIYKKITFKEYLEYQDTLYNLLFLDMKHESIDIFKTDKERVFEVKANLSWM